MGSWISEHWFELSLLLGVFLIVGSAGDTRWLLGEIRSTAAQQAQAARETAVGIGAIGKAFETLISQVRESEARISNDLASVGRDIRELVEQASAICELQSQGAADQAQNTASLVEKLEGLRSELDHLNSGTFNVAAEVSKLRLDLELR
jgi:hypothetical protein